MILKKIFVKLIDFIVLCDLRVLVQLKVLNYWIPNVDYNKYPLYANFQNLIVVVMPYLGCQAGDHLALGYGLSWP